jgi:Protein of unknown function DUF72
MAGPGTIDARSTFERVLVIRIGPAGWKYKDWEGVVYPKPAPRGFDPLAYIAEYFTTVEINTSYYGPPKPETAKNWVESVTENRDFRFTAKLFHSFTHERKPAPEDEHDFKSGIAPIAFAELGLGLCNIDQPLFHRSVKPAAFTTARWATSDCTGPTTRNGFLRPPM